MNTFEIFKNYIGNGMLFILFIIACVFLFIKEKDKVKRTLLIYFPLTVLILFFFPLFHGIVDMMLDEETYYRILWLMPMTATIAYAGVKWILLGMKKWQRVVAMLLCCCLIVFTGDYVYDNPYFSKAENRFHIPQYVAEVCDSIIVEGREVRAAFPSEMLPYVRQYTANICMPYGRNVIVEDWDKTSELYNAMTADEIDCETVSELAKEESCQYVILNASWKLIGTMEEYNYDKVNSVDGYDIYLLEGADISVPSTSS